MLTVARTAADVLWRPALPGTSFPSGGGSSPIGIPGSSGGSVSFPAGASSSPGVGIGGTPTGNSGPIGQGGMFVPMPLGQSSGALYTFAAMPGGQSSARGTGISTAPGASSPGPLPGVSFPMGQQSNNQIPLNSLAGWTPSDQSGAGLVLASSFGTYIKVGRLVFFSFRFTFPSTANALANQISMPFPGVGGVVYVGSCISSGSTIYNVASTYNAAQTFSFVTPNGLVNATNAQLSGLSFFGTCSYEVAG